MQTKALTHGHKKIKEIKLAKRAFVAFIINNQTKGGDQRNVINKRDREKLLSVMFFYLLLIACVTEKAEKKEKNLRVRNHLMKILSLFFHT